MYVLCMHACAHLWHTLVLGQVQAAPKKAARRREETEKAEPATPYDAAVAKVAEMLRTASTAREKAITLTGVQYAGDLSFKLLSFSEDMETCFKKLKQAVTTKDMAKVAEYMAEVDGLEKWWEKAKASRISVHRMPNGSQLDGFVLNKASLLSHIFETQPHFN